MSYFYNYFTRFHSNPVLSPSPALAHSPFLRNLNCLTRRETCKPQSSSLCNFLCSGFSPTTDPSKLRHHRQKQEPYKHDENNCFICLKTSPFRKTDEAKTVVNGITTNLKTKHFTQSPNSNWRAIRCLFQTGSVYCDVTRRFRGIFPFQLHEFAFQS
jgi:hypothetical protein